MSKENKIAYSQCWEDPNLVKKGLDLSSRDNLIIISSGGDNVLNLSLIQPNSIIAIDSNPLQNYLLELKIVAIKSLNYQDYISFLGLKDDKKRWDKYLGMKKNLTPMAANFWDENKTYIKQGIIHCGRFEKFVKIFRKFLIPITHNKKSIKKLFSFNEITEQKDFYNKQWLNKRWKFIFNLFFSRNIFGKFGRSKKMFDYCKTDKVGECFLSRMNSFFEKKLVKENYFICYLFIGKYPSFFYPAYLDKNNFDRLKSSVSCIKIVTDDLIKYADNLNKGKVYKFCLSDIFESCSDEETIILFNKLINNSGSGSKICFWNNLVDRYPSENSKLKYLKEFSNKLYEQDRLFFYNNFFIYEIQ